MLMLRLQRTGRKNEPHFRAVVTDKRNAGKSGKFVEIVGSYNPKAGIVTLKKDRVEYWLKQGVQPSETMHNFLVDQGLVKGKKINVLPKKRPIKKEEEKSEGAVAQAPATPSPEASPVEEKAEPTAVQESGETTKAEPEPVAPASEAETPETTPESPQA